MDRSTIAACGGPLIAFLAYASRLAWQASETGEKCGLRLIDFKYTQQTMPATKSLLELHLQITQSIS